MKSVPYSDAQSEENFRAMLEKWSHISKFRESGSIYTYHKGEIFRRHEALTNRPDLIQEYFQGQLPILIDIEAGHFEEIEALETEFQTQEKAGNPIYWICGIDQFLLGQSKELFHYLRKRQAKNPNISYVLFFNINFLHPTVSSILLYTSTFLQNTHFTPLYDEEMSEYFIRYLLYLWNFQMDESLQQEILRVTKRHPLTLKQAIRYVRDTGTTDLDEIFHHQMMKIKVKSIFDSLLLSEQTALAKITLGANDFTPDENSSIDFLKRTQWFEVQRHHLHLTIPILEQYISSLHRSTQKIALIENRLILNGTPIDGLLSAQEQATMKLFVKKMGQLVSRDDIANVIWGPSWQDSYSDWAIDKLISRLRQKCLGLNLPKSTIQSIKGKGFQYAEC